MQGGGLVVAFTQSQVSGFSRVSAKKQISTFSKMFFLYKKNLMLVVPVCNFQIPTFCHLRVLFHESLFVSLSMK